jgi:YidC/Oxa1 family membrane protein insertase
VSNGNARYTFTSRGGGIKLVELLKYPETVSALRKKKSAQAQDVATLNESAAFAVGALLDDGTVAGGGNFLLTSTATGVRAEMVLTNGLALVKEFRPGPNYLITTTVRVENRGPEAVALPARELVTGTATPLGPQDNGQFEGVMWYNGTKTDDSARLGWFENRTLGCFPGTPRTVFRQGSNNVVWTSAHNQFFTVIAMPEKPAPELVVTRVSLPRFDGPSTAGQPLGGFQATLVYPAVTLPPGQTWEVKLDFFAGPKDYRTLSHLPNNVDLVMNYSGFFGGVARALLLAMNWLHEIVRLPYGWAIIIITFIIKMVFWPLTAASTRSMKRMSEFQPQMKAIQEKFKDDPSKMNRKTMEFMKEHKINPVGGCLPMLIQIPIFIGFYQMIQSAIELRGAPFLWIGDLSQPDTLFIIPGLGFIPFIAVPGLGLPVNLLPLIMGATQIWQMSLTPPSPGMDPTQQKMMRYMPLMFLVILYNFSAGLTLYWTVQNLLSILQTKLTKTQPAAAVVAAPALKKNR